LKLPSIMQDYLNVESDASFWDSDNPEERDKEEN
jgi:hypothetical protein